MVDVAVIGSGIHGLVSAAILADAGLHVVVLEQSDGIGGAIRSGEVTLPGYTHDLYAMNMNLFLGSPFWATHGPELAADGLTFTTAHHPYASTFPDGRSLRISTNTHETERMWRAHSAEDAAGWSRLRRHYDDFTAIYGPIYTRPLPSASLVRSLRAVWRTRRTTPLSTLLPLVTSSTRGLGERFFATPEARSLVSAWGMHLDFAPDIASGALFPLLELYGNMTGGMSVVQGGASHLPEAIARFIRSRGCEIRTGESVAHILTSASGRVTGVRLASGETVRAAQGVITTTPLPLLVNHLMDRHRVPRSMQTAADRYRFGPGTFMLHLALDGRIPWLDSELAETAYVHIGPYVDDMARTYQQAMAGVLPDEPLLVVGQPSVIDAGRVPTPGHHTAWIEVRMVPGDPRADSLGTLSGGWDAIREGYADRIIDKLERYAPGVRAHILASSAMSPADLERHNPNLVGGDSVSGSHHQDQLLGMRPSWDLAHYATPVPGLYLAGAATWPGAGVNAISGQLAAERLLRNRRRPSRPTAR